MIGTSFLTEGGAGGNLRKGKKKKKKKKKRFIGAREDHGLKKGFLRQKGKQGRSTAKGVKRGGGHRGGDGEGTKLAKLSKKKKRGV